MVLRVVAPLCLIALCPVILTAQVTDTSEELQSIKEQVRSLSENLTRTVEQVGEHETKIGQLRNDLLTLSDQINEELRKQEQILAAISREDSAGRHVPRLSAAMESSDEFRHEMRKVVNNSLDTSGTLRVANKTSQYQHITINRTDYGVSAGETLTLKVPVGTVTTQLPGRDLENWAMSAPKYEQNIDIVPTNTPAPVPTYVARPVYVPPPVYYDPWAFYSDIVYIWP